MEDSERINSGPRATGASTHWLISLYPLWQWLVLIPASAIATVVAALGAIVLSALGMQRRANLEVAARWARFIAHLTPMRVQIEGAEHIAPGQSYVVVSNHQSQYDIPLIYGFSGLDLRWVMKAEIGKLPFIAQGCRAIGHIFIDRGNPEQARATINSAVAKLPRGASVLFFPEGTRSRTGDLIKFRKGAFRVAVDRKLPVLPMTVVGTRGLLSPGSLRIRPGRVRLVIHPPMHAVDGSVDQAVTELSQRTRRVIATPLQRRGSEAGRGA